MNWLAHIFLSEDNIQFQIGNYLADPLKGKSWENIPLKIHEGMKLHTIIDTFTDNHPLFQHSKKRLGSKGLLKAVVIDLTYDYLLSKNWHHFSNISLEDFLKEFHNKAYLDLDNLPSPAKIKLQRMLDFQLLYKYQSLEDLYHAFKRVDQRLSVKLAKRDLVSNYYEKVCQEIDYLEKDFLHFFPQLCNEVKQHVNKHNLSHWKGTLK